MTNGQSTKRQANCRCWLLPALAVVLALPLVGKAQGIVFEQLPPSPSLGLVQNTNGDWVDPFAPYDAQGLRLWGTLVNPSNYDLILNGQTAFIFSSGDSFSITAVGSNAVTATLVGGSLPTSYVVPLTSGQPIGPNAAGYDWIPGGLLTATRASDTIGQPNLTIGYFSGLASAYIGLEFYTDGQPYYGWVRVGAPATINGGWIYDYAYETTPNTPISAGEIPEPSTLSLSILGVLSIFLTRKRFSL